MDTLQKRISFALELSKNKPADLARYIGVSESAVSQWLNGTSEAINSIYLLKVSSFLKVNPQWLVSGKGSPFKIKQYHINDNIVSENEREWLDLIKMLNNEQQQALFMSMSAMVDNETKKLLN